MCKQRRWGLERGARTKAPATVDGDDRAVIRNAALHGKCTQSWLREIDFREPALSGFDPAAGEREQTEDNKFVLKRRKRYVKKHA